MVARELERRSRAPRRVPSSLARRKFPVYFFRQNYPVHKIPTAFTRRVDVFLVALRRGGCARGAGIAAEIARVAPDNEDEA